MTHHADRLGVRADACTLMDPRASPAAQRESALALHKVLSEHIGLDDSAPTPDDYQESHLPSGKAISPQDAARCLPDYVRTGRFLRGVVDAVSAARSTFPDETVRVLYAGCGPFAILVLPIAHQWTSDEVRFTLVDYHPRSLNAARQVADFLGVLDRIDSFVQADAATYRCPSDALPHVLITETMQRALEKEPQVSITTNLTQQLRAGGLIVPEQIELHLTLMNPDKEFGFDLTKLERERRELGCVMLLNQTGNYCYDITWPDFPMAKLLPFIRTYIRVFGDIVIDDYESGLTIPMVLSYGDEKKQPLPGQRVHFEYHLEPTPQLVCIPSW